MAIRNQFGAEGEAWKATPEACAMCEALLPEAVDGSLTAVEKAVFERHVAGCADCSRELEEAQRGAAWLSLLKDHAPEPPTALLQRILADTTGAGAPSVAGAQTTASPVFGDAATPVWATLSPWGQAKPGWWVSVRRRVADAVRIEQGQTGFHPRFAMTAAMAFFSVALSLNMAGFRISDLKAEYFTPSGVRRVVADAGATAERRFQNLRVVYQMESRVNELRTAETDSAGGSPFGAGTPAQDRKQNSRPDNRQGAAPDAPAKGHENVQPRGASRLQFPTVADPKRRAMTEGMS